MVTSKFFYPFFRDVITELRVLGKVRTSETYLSALSSFRKFMKGKDLRLSSINQALMISYELYLRDRMVCPNTISFYMRILRAVYNRAVDSGLTEQRFPFRKVYTGIDKTAKRALSIKDLRRVKNIDLSGHPARIFPRDLFILSFYTRGMSFVDLAYLKKSDIKNNTLTYRRHKTGQMISVHWEKCMQEIVERHGIESSPYLLPIIKYPGKDERHQYMKEAHRVNERLKEIGIELNLGINLTMYVSRHSWASTARSKKIPLSIISSGLGHDSETTTQIYLASVDSSEIDRANKIIINNL